MLKVNLNHVNRFNSMKNKSFTNLIIALKSGISNLIKFLKI